MCNRRPVDNTAKDSSRAKVKEIFIIIFESIISNDSNNFYSAPVFYLFNQYPTVDIK